jgi:septum formation protein
MSISEGTPLLLASASPRRRELLELARVPFAVVPTEADEAVRDGEDPLAYVARVARAKAQGAEVKKQGAVLLAADTTVIADGRILGKPTDDADARAMIERLSGRTHEVATAFILAHPQSRQTLCERTVRTGVTFRKLDAAEIEAYVATGEGRDKAGAYAVQGLASAFVTRIDGSWTNVVGLPTAEVILELRRLSLL